MKGQANREAPPLDRSLDRRDFIGRMAAISAAASAGGLAGPFAPLALGGEVGPTRAGAAATLPAATHPALSSRAALADSVRPEALDDPAELTIAEAALLIRNGNLSPATLVEACLARIERLDGVYRAFNTVAGENAMATASALTGQPARSALHGIPLAIKDNYFTAGLLTTANSLIFQEFVPEYDATAVAGLKRAGGIVLGKTQMGPLATTRATTPEGRVTTISAWAPDNPRVSPGGSSSGSATAVAARLALSATGTQTGGSITSPALAQGLTGLKPTLGLVSLHGVIPLSYTRDHPGPIARDALDAAIMLQAMAGPDPRDPRTLGLPDTPDLIRAARPVRIQGRVRLRWPTRIGVPPGFADGSGPVAAMRQEMLATFDRLGAQIVDVSLPDEWYSLGRGSFNNVRLVERAEPFLEHLKTDVRMFGVSLSAWINGLLLSGDEYLTGQRARLRLLQTVIDYVFNQCDVLAQSSHLPFDMIGLPLIAFPIAMREGNEEIARPAGAILGGQPFAEDRLLSLAAAYQAVTDWHLRRPPEPSAESTRRAGPPGPGAPPDDRGRITAEEIMELTE